MKIDSEQTHALRQSTLVNVVNHKDIYPTLTISHHAQQIHCDTSIIMNSIFVFTQSFQ